MIPATVGSRRLMTAAPALTHTRAAQKATVFALIGDRYHNSDYVREGLRRTIQRDMGVSVDFSARITA